MIKDIVKVTFDYGKIKLFSNATQAAFEIGASIKSIFKIELIPVFCEEGNYWSMEKFEGDCEHIKYIKPKQGYLVSEIIYSASTSPMIVLSGAANRYLDDETRLGRSFYVWKDDNGTIYKIKDRLEFELPSTEYTRVKSVLESAIAERRQFLDSETAKEKLRADCRNAEQKLAKHKESFFVKQENLKEQQEAMEIEADQIKHEEEELASKKAQI